MNTLAFIASILGDFTVIAVTCIIGWCIKKDSTKDSVSKLENTPGLVTTTEESQDTVKKETPETEVEVKSMDAVIRAANELMGISTEEGINDNK